MTLALGAFLMQVCVQGAWGVVPAHLNELAPADARGTFAGTCYQLGNLIAAVNLPLQTAIADTAGGDYSARAARWSPPARRCDRDPGLAGAGSEKRGYGGASSVRCEMNEGE